MRGCDADGCQRPHKGNGLCATHLYRWRKYGFIDLPTAEEQFWAKVDATGICWEWTGYTDDGYGRVTTGPRGSSGQQAHRVAWEYLVGPIPPGLQLDHLCRNRRCVNPDHLQPVTPKINTERSASPSARNIRKTHGPRGHEYTEANTRILPNGARTCRICGRAAARAWKARNPERVAAYMKQWREAQPWR